MWAPEAGTHTKYKKTFFQNKEHNVWLLFRDFTR